MPGTSTSMSHESTVSVRRRERPKRSLIGLHRRPTTREWELPGSERGATLNQGGMPAGPRLGTRIRRRQREAGTDKLMDSRLVPDSIQSSKSRSNVRLAPDPSEFPCQKAGRFKPSCACRLKSAPSSPGPLGLLGMTERLVHDDAVGPVAGVDPDHGHGLERQVDEVVAAALGDQRGGVAREFVAPAFDDAGRRSLHDGDRLVELMAMAGQTRTGLEHAVAATDSLRAEVGIVEVLEVRPRGQLEPCGGVVTAKTLGPRVTGRRCGCSAGVNRPLTQV